MLGEVYIASALAVFFAIFGWSDILFGLSKTIKEKEAEFMKKANLDYARYISLKNLLRKPIINSVDFTKKLLKLIRGSKLKENDSIIFDIIRKNETIIKESTYTSKTKKILFFVLFFYLFIIGSFLIYLENMGFNLKNAGAYNIIVLIFQIVLFSLIIIGLVIYGIDSSKNSKVQKGLNDLILRL